MDIKYLHQLVLTKGDSLHIKPFKIKKQVLFLKFITPNITPKKIYRFIETN